MVQPVERQESQRIVLYTCSFIVTGSEYKVNPPSLKAVSDGPTDLIDMKLHLSSFPSQPCLPILRDSASVGTVNTLISHDIV